MLFKQKAFKACKLDSIIMHLKIEIVYFGVYYYL